MRERREADRAGEAILERHRPLNGWCAAIIIGALAGYAFGHPFGWLCAATVAVCLAWIWRRGAAFCLCVALGALLAWRAAGAHDARVRLDETVAAHRHSETPMTLRVTVGDDLRMVKTSARAFPHCRFHADRPTLEDGTPIRGVEVAVVWYDNAHKGRFPAIGETWRLHAKPYWQGTQLTFTAHAERAERLAEASPFALAPRLRAIRDRLAKHLALGVTFAEARYVQTMTLGVARPIPREDLQRYADAGIIHILSISGLHVAIVAALLVGLLRWAGPTLRACLLIPALLAYLLLIGAPPPAARACLMAVIYALAPCFRRRPDAPSALLLTAAIVLTLDPTLIADAGALLSFCVMGGILLLLGPLSHLFAIVLFARRAPDEHGRPPLFLLCRRTLALVMGLSLAAWIAALPLCLAFFGRLSLIGLLLNLVLPGLACLVVWGGCVSMLAGFLLPGLSAAINAFNAGLLHTVDFVAARALRLPGAIYEAQAYLDVPTLIILQSVLLALGLSLHAWHRHLAPPSLPEENPSPASARRGSAGRA